MSRTLVAVCLVLAMASVSFADTVIGNWETSDPTPGWSVAGTAYMEVVPGPGNTLGDNSLLVAVNGSGYWPLNYIFSTIPTLKLMGTKLKIDVTTTPEQCAATGWADFAEKISVNSDGPSGYKEYAGKWVLRGDNSPTGHDWGPWFNGKEARGTFDLQNYDSTGATWMNVWFSFQGWPGATQIDNVLLTPEPATMALLGLGGLALIRRKR